MTYILTAAEMRAAEQRAIDGGTSVDALMERAGTAAAEAIWRFAGPLPALVLCGPGNNGGDGYMIAAALRARGVKVRVAADGPPKSEAAMRGREAWDGEIVSLAEAKGAPLLVDALFGTGLARPFDADTAQALGSLAREAQVRIAIDLPSGAATDNGALLSPMPDYDATITFGALKPSHLLQPAARHIGRIVIADIGVTAESALQRIERPRLPPPGPDDHKYRRGYVAILAGAMPGAAALSTGAAARSGAGYVRLVSEMLIAGVAHAIVQGDAGADAVLADERVGAVLIGPGLGRGPDGKALLDKALASGRPLILDADALMLLGTARSLRAMAHMPILTPHEGEFAALFDVGGSKVERARAAAREAGAVLVLKGADTVIAHPGGRAAIARPAPAWLATAGTGDVLAGVVAAMRARHDDPFEAAMAAVWLHGKAAQIAGVDLVADDLLDALPAALAACR